MVEIKQKKKLLAGLNRALAWELRAYAMYAHYAVYVKGLESLSLKPHFEEEAAESIGHAGKVREIIGMLGGQATTERDPAPILHLDDHRAMLEEALKTERAAAETYKKLIPLAREHVSIVHELNHILMSEMNSVVEVQSLLGR